MLNIANTLLTNEKPTFHNFKFYESPEAPDIYKWWEILQFGITLFLLGIFLYS